MKKTHAVGIDLGTTYSCIAWLNEHGHPITIPNQEGELATPSVVFFDENEAVIGTEALRNAIASPDRVVQNAKRHIGNAEKTWLIDGVSYSPSHISGLILRKLIAAAQRQIGEISEAVVTVPAQFSDAQRHATIQAGHAAGLERVEIINEPVAAALCHVLGSEGLAFTELAIDQQLLVFDLGGGTLDLAIVNYTSDSVRVIASDGDLKLGGLDWTQTLVDIAAERFAAEFREDPRKDAESHQFLALEAEQAKRSLSVRPRAAITVQHGANRQTYQIGQEEFEDRSHSLISRSEGITRRILSKNGFGWAHIDVVLMTGGSSRMPMVRNSLKQLSGRTLNSSLSPDQSIAHGAAYYAGMLLSNQQHTRTVFNSQASSRLSSLKQQGVNARGLGILIRDTNTGKRIPVYLIPPNTPLPASRTHVFGTVVDHQTKVHVRIVESGTGPGHAHTVLGDCHITDLPPDLPEGSEVEVTISYDRNARVHVSARELRSGRSAEAEIIRQENVLAQLQEDTGLTLRKPAEDFDEDEPVSIETEAIPELKPISDAAPSSADTDKGIDSDWQIESADPEQSLTNEWAAFSESLNEFTAVEPDSIDSQDHPVPLCNVCGGFLGKEGVCPNCGEGPPKQKRKKKRRSAKAEGQSAPRKRRRKSAKRKPAASPPPPPAEASAGESTGEAEFWELLD